MTMRSHPTAGARLQRSGLLRLGWPGLLLVATPLLVEAQADPTKPQGPADIISGARKAREVREMQQAVDAVGPAAAAQGAKPSDGAPSIATPSDGASSTGLAPAAAAPSPDGNEPASAVAGPLGVDRRLPGGHPPVASPHAAAGQPAKRQPMSEGSADTALPVGSLRVQVVDDTERPLPNAAIRLGILKSNGTRESIEASTDAQGQHLFTDLPAGDRQAYRVNVPADGARFSSTPFRLPHQHGYRVLVRRLKTTRDSSDVVLYVGAISLELKDDRLKVVQQQRLVNIGQAVHVFPEGGLRMRLPEGFTAFQSQEVMGDQRIAADETHLKLEGSLPPGQTTLMWGFDVPVEGSEKVIEVENPLLTFAYRVLSDAPEGMTLSVDGMPDATLREDGSKRYWVTELARRPGKDGLKRLVLRVGGIPGPGPMRWVAALFASLALAIGLGYSRRPPASEVVVDSAVLADQKEALLLEARQLDKERAAGAIGPEYHAEERARLVDALSVVLWQLDRSEQSDRKKKPG